MTAVYYVVREWVRPRPGTEKELRTHVEYPTFNSYREANDAAKMVENGMAFPQQVKNDAAANASISHLAWRGPVTINLPLTSSTLKRTIPPNIARGRADMAFGVPLFKSTPGR